MASSGGQPMPGLEDWQEQIEAKLDVFSRHIHDLTMENRNLRAQLQSRRRAESGRIRGVHLAVIAGGKVGEAVEPDTHGQVEIAVLFDESVTAAADKQPDRQVLKARVATPWLTDGGGIQFSLRKGQTVLVAFLDADPAHPWIIGHAPADAASLPYNPNSSKPKKTLHPESSETSNRFKTVISSASPGSNGKKSEIVFVDEPNKEQLTIFSQGDLHVQAKKSHQTFIGTATWEHHGHCFKHFGGAMENTFFGNKVDLSLALSESVFVGNKFSLCVSLVEDIFLGAALKVNLSGTVSISVGPSLNFSIGEYVNVKVSGGVDVVLAGNVKVNLGASAELVYAATLKHIDGESVTIWDGLETKIVNGATYNILNGFQQNLVNGVSLTSKTVKNEDGLVERKDISVTNGAYGLKVDESIVKSGDAMINKYTAGLTSIG